MSTLVTPTSCSPPVLTGLISRDYATQVFRLYDFNHRDEVTVDDMPYVLTALGYDPDATLSAAISFMCDDDAGSSTTRTPTIAQDANMNFLRMSTRPIREVPTVVKLDRFLSGLAELQAMRGGVSDLVSTSFRLFDIQRRGIISIEDMIATACLGGNSTLSAEECKDIVQSLKGSSSIKGLTLRDFRTYLGS
jgi:Ca2+-binding EF-hand superfamily protein